ncbi:MAG: tyrosine-type recombinase/integrase, partial [Caldisericia bacterium]|nr:tyrosine-type recombinase/integrase [Caldisericia bacterium]
RADKNKELFLTNNQKNMTSENLHYVVKNILAESGLEGSAHTLRHTFVTELVRIGVSLPVIQSLVGHRNANTTIRYTHIISKDRRSAVSKINLDFSKTK